MKLLEGHEIANLWPMMDNSSLSSLAESINQHVLRDDVVLYEDAILDGRNRYKACLQVGVPPRFRQYGSREGDGDNAVDFAVDQNQEHRPALTGEARRTLMLGLREQYASEAEKHSLANLKRGIEPTSPMGSFEPIGRTSEKVARAVGASPSTVKRVFHEADVASGKIKPKGHVPEVIPEFIGVGPVVQQIVERGKKLVTDLEYNVVTCSECGHSHMCKIMERE